MIFISFADFDLLLNYPRTSFYFKVYALSTIGKTISIIIFLRVIREIRIVLDVLINSAIFLIDVIGMMGIVMLLFSSVGMTIFGGVINSKSLATYEAIVGNGYDEGLQFLNFNDYMNSLNALLAIILSGWQDLLKLNCFSMPNKSMSHNYYFVAFFICANLFLLNVLTGFIIDNIVAYLSEDIIIENDEDQKFKKGVKESFIGKAYDFITDKASKMTNRGRTGTVMLNSVLLTDKKKE